MSKTSPSVKKFLDELVKIQTIRLAGALFNLLKSMRNGGGQLFTVTRSFNGTRIYAVNKSLSLQRSFLKAYRLHQKYYRTSLVAKDLGSKIFA